MVYVGSGITYPWFQAFTGGLGTYCSWIRGTYCSDMGCKSLIEEVVGDLGSGLISSLSLGISHLWEQLSLQYQQGPQCQKHQNKKKKKKTCLTQVALS